MLKLAESWGMVMSCYATHNHDGPEREQKCLRQELAKTAKELAEYEVRMQRLEQKAQLYHQIVDNSPNPIFSINPQGIILTWNPACSAKFLYDENMIGEHFGTLMASEEQLDFIVKQMSNMSCEYPLTNVDLSYRCKNGEVREMVSRIYTVHNANQSVEGYVLANTDITERNIILRELKDYRTRLEEIVDERTAELIREINDRRRAQKALKSSNDALTTILDTIEVEISVTDLHTDEVIFVNKHLRNTIKEESSRCRAARFCPPHGRDEKDQNLLTLTWGKGEQGEGVTRVFFSEVFSRWYMLHDQPVRWVDGRTVLLQVATDITERKRIDLEQQRVAKLESIGMLAGGIAHDFNNLLTGILGSTSLLRIHREKDGNPRLLENIEKAALQAKNLTNQLLTFSKGGAPIRKPASIANLINEAVDFALGGSSVSCVKEISDNLLMAEVDAGQFIQVIHNVVFNATQAMSDGGELEVTGENIVLDGRNNHGLSPGKYLRLEFKDNGPGIADGDLPKIFDPYFTTKSTGSGLGLATSHTIIQKHQGYIAARSENGAVVTILLPAVEGVNPVSMDRQRPLKSLSGRILVMDDEKIIRQVIEEMLTELGCKTVTVPDGETALALYRQAAEENQPFDAVILDLTVRGGMGGQETFEYLRDFDQDVKAIVSSGYSNDPIMASYRDFGFCDVVTKPYRIEEMYEVMKRLLDQ